MRQHGVMKQSRSRAQITLPSYDVFDEERYFEPAEGPIIYDWKGKKVGITICEDIWTHPDLLTSRRYCNDPLSELAQQKLTSFKPLGQPARG